MNGKMAAVVATFIPLCAGGMAQAFSCVAIMPEAVYRHEGLIVRAKVWALNSAPAQGPWRVTLKVMKSWKGSVRVGETATVMTPGPRQECGFFIRQGDEFLV